MLKVGVFTDNDFEKVNGVTTALRAVLDHAPRDVSIRVYTCDSSGIELPNYLSMKARGIGIPYYNEMKMYFPPILRLLNQARADRLDVIHLTTPGPVGLAAVWVASKLQLPLVGSFHTHLAEYTERLSGSRRLGALMQEYLRWSYGKCRQILAPSHATRAALIASRMDATRINVWSRGVCTDTFNPSWRSSALRTSWRLSDDRPGVLYVGRLSREKGLGDLYAIERALQSRRVPHRLILVGDGPMRAELEASLPDALFTGMLPRDRVAEAMASCDLFVFPSRTDTAGNVVLEAQASGVPVLVTDEGGPLENMVPHQTGLVCASVREMARNVMSLSLQTGRRLSMGRAARDYAESRRWDAALAPLYQAYREVVATARSRRVASGIAAA